MDFHAWIGSPRALYLGLDIRAALTRSHCISDARNGAPVPPCGEVMHTGKVTPVPGRCIADQRWQPAKTVGDVSGGA